MKRNFLLMGLLVLGLGMSFTSCGDDDDNNNENGNGNVVDNATAVGFGNAFKNHVAGSGYTSAESCVEQIIDGCIDIANEVGTSKIGEPYDLYISGNTEEALYAVESWYSWHSRDDYKNNIVSIANSLVNVRIEDLGSFDYSSIMKSSNPTASIMVKFASRNDIRSYATTVWQDVVAAWNAIDNIPQPFRNNINSKETVTAMQACATLVSDLEKLKGKISELSESDCQEIIDNYVDIVVLPTYKDLNEKNSALYTAVLNLQKNPSDKNFEAACDAWMDARQPWETSEAFLFGPVSELGLDPNMDSWPLDEDGIKGILASQKWSDLDWSGDYDEENEAIEAAQSLRGFHTLEYLLFLDGNPRTTSDANYSASTDAWLNYSVNVALLLKQDAALLYKHWTEVEY